VNLSKISSNLYSHPDYPYIKHVSNIAASFSESTHKKTAYFHDIGKLCKEFQNFINDPDKSKKTTHALESALIYLFNNNLEITSESFPIFISILKHHGDLENINSFVNEKLSDEGYISYRYPRLIDKIEHIKQHTDIELDFELNEFCDIFDEENFVKSNKLGGLRNYFRIKEVFSKLIFADKYEAIFREPYLKSEFSNVDLYLNRLLELLSKKKNPLSEIRNQARNEVIDNFKNNLDKKVYLIEAPTGIGKTYTALQLALEIVKTKEKNRIINALPMTSIIDQTFEEYSKIIDNSDLLKFHYLTYSKKYFNTDEEEENQIRQKNDYLTTSWTLDKVIVTTFNQLFNCFYSNKNRDLIKFWTLRNSVIILDEIQTIPRILLKDISETINFIAREFNIDFILMSATIPAIKEFLETNLTCELLDNVYFSMDFNNRYLLSFNKDLDNIDLLSEEILEKSKLVNSTLCVVNTKKLASDLFKQLEDNFKDEEILLLSANFIPIHRKLIIEDIKQRLDNKQKIILISTQVIEAGVDLDFDYGFREFSPLSGIIQTAGRVNREGNKNDSKLIVTGKIGSTPYHTKDISFEEVKELLLEDIEEKDILKTLKKYFKIVINKTSPDTMLIGKMENLEFEDVMKKFSENFMQNIPSMSSIFIEVKEGLYNKIKTKHEEILEKLKSNNTNLREKMAIKIKLKELHKEISKYLIHVPEKEANYFPEMWENSHIYYCPFTSVKDDGKYSYRKGWKSENESYL